MDNICTACLCSGRKLYFIAETDYYYIYSNILNEIPVYDLSEICVRICWECRALLHRFHVFKQRVKKSHTELLDYFSQPIRPKFPPTNPPNLQIHLQHTTSYPEVKLEPIDIKDPVEVDLLIKDERDHLQRETEFTHCDLDETEDTNCGPNETEDTHCGPNETEDTHCGPNETDETHREPVTFVRVFDIRGDSFFLDKQKRKSKLPKVKTKKEKKSPKKKRAKIIKEDLKINENNISEYDDTTYADNCDVEDCKAEKIIEDKIEVNELVCLDCDLVFDNKEEMERHKELEKHTSDLKVVAIANGALKRGRVKEDLPDKPKCAECGKQFSSKKTYRYHRNVIHRGQNQHPCPRCDKVFQWRSNLGRHLRSHKARDSGELYCQLCDKKFASVATYQQHLKLSKKHVDETQFNFMCNECGRKFVTKARLRDHIDWEHLQKVKFRCQLCNKPFKSHTALYMHRRTAHPAAGEKRAHLCHVCGKCYTNPNKLKYHIVAMHTHETPYKCTLCDTAFRWYSSLYRHTREVHYKMRLQPNRHKGKKLRKEQAPPEH